MSTKTSTVPSPYLPLTNILSATHFPCPRLRVHVQRAVKQMAGAGLTAIQKEAGSERQKTRR